MTPLGDMDVHVTNTLAVLSLGQNTIHGFVANSFSKVRLAVPPTGISKVPCSILPPILPFNKASVALAHIYVQA